jgi:hypothetical protein
MPSPVAPHTTIASAMNDASAVFMMAPPLWCASRRTGIVIAAGRERAVDAA